MASEKRRRPKVKTSSRGGRKGASARVVGASPRSVQVSLSSRVTALTSEEILRHIFDAALADDAARRHGKRVCGAWRDAINSIEMPHQRLLLKHKMTIVAKTDGWSANTMTPMPNGLLCACDELRLRINRDVCIQLELVCRAESRRRRRRRRRRWVVRIC